MRILQKILIRLFALLMIVHPIIGVPSECGASPLQAGTNSGVIRTRLFELAPFPFAFIRPVFEALFFPSGTDGDSSSENGDIPFFDPAKPFIKEDLEKFIPGDEKLSLTLFLLSETEEVFRSDFENFQSAYPDISLKIRTFRDEGTYVTELRKAFLNNEIPDIFLVNTELFEELLYEGELTPAPHSILHPLEITTYFHPIAETFVHHDQVWAAPLFGHFLMMYSNASLLGDPRIFVASKPGKTWKDLFSNKTNYMRYGSKTVVPIALGDPKNFPYTFDVFLLLLQQSGSISLEDQPAQESLEFILSMGKDQRGMEKEKSDIELFIDEKIAVIFGDESTYYDIIDLLRKTTEKGHLVENDIQFHLVPQFDTESPVTLGDVWGFAVSKDTGNGDFAWAIITSLSDERKSKQHFLKTRLTSLLKNIPNSALIPENASYGVTGQELYTLEFRKLFNNTVSSLLDEKRTTPAPNTEEVLQSFSEFLDDKTSGRENAAPDA